MLWGDTMKRMSRNKAPGLDEWRVYEMRAWPTHLHEAAATLLEEVEQTAKWPTELGGPLGILLEKRRDDRPDGPASHLAHAHAT